MTKQKTIQLIEDKLVKVKNKKILSRFLASKLEMSASSVYNHWLGGTLAIPENKQEEVLMLITNFLKADK